MKNDQIRHLLSSPVSFLADSGPDEDIAISSRIRLARNLKNYPFPCAADLQQKQEICELVSAAACNSRALGCPDCLTFELPQLSSLEREILLERRLASREFISQPEGAKLLVRKDESCSVMINEEDQLRIQVLAPGFQLEKVWEKYNVYLSKTGE